MGEDGAKPDELAAFIKPLDRLISSAHARQRYDGGVLLICLAGATLGRTLPERLTFLAVYLLYTFVMASIDRAREARALRTALQGDEQSRIGGDELTDELVSVE